jgi:hypothetical protein
MTGRLQAIALLAGVVACTKPLPFIPAPAARDGLPVQYDLCVEAALAS